LINKLLSYSGINTKIKAMAAKLISEEEYKKIANLDSISDFISFLSGHPGYREIFADYDEGLLHRTDVERILSNALYLDFAKIYRFADPEQRRDLDLLLFRYEVTLIKTLIRVIYSGEDAMDLSVFYSLFEAHSSINLSVLSASKTMEEFIMNLKGTQYYSVLEKLHDTGNPTSFDYEMTLDQYYFKKVWKLKEKLLSGQNYKAFTSQLGTEIDLLNIMWIYRSKRIYNVNATDSFAFIIPITYKLSQEQLTKMAASNSMEEFAEILKDTYYTNMYHALLNGTLESNYKKMIDKIYKMNVTKYPSSMSSANAYLYMKEMEISRLTTAIECIRYKLSPQDKLSYIMP